MEKKKLSVGNYKIILDIKRKLLRKEIIKKYSLNPTQYNFFKYIANNNLFLKKSGLRKFDTEKVRESGMGFKNEPYFTEEEMIEGFKCTWKDLSIKEKAFYYSYEKNIKNAWSEQEIIVAQFYYYKANSKLKYENWEYVKQMMDQSGLYPTRSLNSYRDKLQKIWREKLNNK